MRGLGAALIVALGVAAGAAQAGPCTEGISRLQTAYDATLNATAAAGPTASESTAATLHHQPTLNSVAGAEEKLGELSPEKVEAFQAAMARARQADDRADAGACRQALGEARRALRR